MSKVMSEDIIDAGTVRTLATKHCQILCFYWKIIIFSCFFSQKKYGKSSEFTSRISGTCLKHS